MDTLRCIESFVKAVEHGSIAAAARQMGISAAAASQNIARLEKSLHLRLLTRSTRKLTLTDHGSLYYSEVKDAIQDIERAGANVTALAGEPQGRLRVACSAAFGRHVIAPLIPKFLQLYPRISLELILGDQLLDHIKEDIDVTIRFQQQLEPGLIARKIAKVPVLFCASPAYLERHGTPQEPEDLRQHDCIVFRMPNTGKLLQWGFIREGLRFEPEINPVITCNDIDAMATMALGGAGIARLGAFIADPLVKNGKLKALFMRSKNTQSTADHEPLEFYATFLAQEAKNKKIRCWVHFLVEELNARDLPI